VYGEVKVMSLEKQIYDKMSHLPAARTPHFNIYYYQGGVAEKEIDTIKTQREVAYEKIAEYLGFTEDLKMDLYLFEDENTKAEVTGYIGAGLAYGKCMAEVYNAQCKLNPYHELVHIIAGYMYGDSVSAMAEGLAVYLTNNLNDMQVCSYDMDEVNGAYDEKVREFKQSGELFALKDLLSLSIGTEESKPDISYRQAASLVEFTIKAIGKHNFFNLYASLSSADINDAIEKIETAYKQKIEDIEKQWLEYVIK